MAWTNRHDGHPHEGSDATPRSGAGAGSAGSLNPLLARLLGDVRQYWWVVALSVAIALASAAVSAGRQVPVYQARTTLMVTPVKTLKEPREIADSLDTLDRRSVIATLALYPSSRTVTDQARQRLQLSPEQFARFSAKTAVVPDSNVLELTVSGPDPRMASMLANTIADLSVAGTGGLYSIFEMQVLDRAVQPPKPLGTAIPRMLFAAALLGAMIGIAAAYAIGSLRRRQISPAGPALVAVEADEPDDEQGRDKPRSFGSSAILQMKPYGKPRRPVASSDDD